MTVSQHDRSRARARTRKALLDAAVSLLATNPAATMGEIAEAAGTARSTVHRHFPERANLITALEAYAEEQLAEAALCARLEDGTAAEALSRLAQEYFARGDLLVVAYDTFTRSEVLDSMEGTAPILISAVERGHADGSIDRALSPVWVEQTLWSLLYAAWLMATAGRSTRHEALNLLLLSLRKMLAT